MSTSPPLKSQVRPTNPLIGFQCASLPRQQGATQFKHIRILGDVQRQVGILLDQ
ncbi:hypothetical protein D3C84_1316360 [compost metagenome]